MPSRLRSARIMRPEVSAFVDVAHQRHESIARTLKPFTGRDRAQSENRVRKVPPDRCADAVQAWGRLAIS